MRMSNKSPQFNNLKAWFKKLGLIGFLFFFVKGLLWLIIPYLVVKGII